MPSANPSINPSTAGDAPSTPVTKNGRTGYSNSDAVSCRNDTSETTLTLRLNGSLGEMSGTR